MEKPRRSELKYTLATAAVLTAVALLGLGTPPDQRASDNSYRQGIYEKYHLTVPAQNYLLDIPFQITGTTAPGSGGGMSYDYPFRHFVIYSPQDEALVHESSHQWYDHMQDQNPNFGRLFDGAVKDVADESPKGSYFAEIYYGDENGDNPSFKGLKGNYTEEYASISSYDMGAKDKMPKELLGYYSTLYKFDR